MSSEPFSVARPDLERVVGLRSQEDQCSIAWGVVSSSELVLSGGSAADPDALPTEHTVFRIASMTKSFTAAAIMILRDRGVLRLDDVVAEIAPEFAAVIGPSTDSPPITVRDLLTMAAGLATDDAWADRHLHASDDELDAWVAPGTLFAWPPRTQGEYSNLGYAMLGRIIRRITDLRPQAFITANLLQPLGMHRTRWRQPDNDDWARPYEMVDDRRVAEPASLGDGAIAPMGGLWSCVSDLARWVAWFTEAFPPRNHDDPGPLRRASRREMQQLHRAWPTWRTAAPDGGDAASTEPTDGDGYGYGLFVTHDHRFGHIVTHSGGLPGYGSNMRWLPAHGVGVIALGNVTYAPMKKLTRAMLRLLDDHGLVAAVPARPAPDLVEMAQRLARLLSDWTDDAADELFSDNVALDESLARRAQRASDLVAAHGALVLVDVAATTATSGRATMRHSNGSEVRIDLDLSPLVPPRVQFYEVVGG
ncbi:MAG: serine hydrolase domain-containing protein [Ilumatobacteraceae bacterium]